MSAIPMVSICNSNITREISKGRCHILINGVQTMREKGEMNFSYLG